MRRITKHAPTRRLGLQTLRGAWQRLSMALMLVMLTTMTAWAESNLGNCWHVPEAAHPFSFTYAGELTGGEATTLDAGWYVVNSDITYTGKITLAGDVNLILADGCTMSVTAGELVAVVAPFTLNISDDAIDELYAIASEKENKVLLYPVSTVKPGTPCVAKFNTDTYSAEKEVTLTDGKEFVMPWEGGHMTVDAANYTWNYVFQSGEGSTPGQSLEKVVLDFSDPNEFHFNVNLENLAARRYLEKVDYIDAIDESRVAEFNVAPPARRDIPNAVMLPLPPFDADEVEVNVRDNDTEETVASVTVARGETEAYVYNLLPRHNYKYSVDDNEVGKFETVGHLRMVYAPSAYNIRDLGGWETQDRRRTTYGHLFRGSTLNGYVNCAPEDIQALKDLGIGGEIDLRWKSDYGKDMDCGTSAFGFTGDHYYFAAANDYTAANLNEAATQGRLKEEFEFIIDHFRQGKAVYLHGASGADRTGMLSFLLEGVLGMTIDQIYKDYELSSFSAAPDATNCPKTLLQDCIDVILALDGATLRDKFENYFLNKLQVPMADITYFRSVMLDIYPLRVDEDADLTGYYDGRADITFHRTLQAGKHNTVVLPCDLTLWESQYFFGEGTKIENIVAYEDGVLKTEAITKDTDIAPANKPFLLIPTSVRDDNTYTLQDVPIRQGDLTDATFTCGKMVGSYAATCDIAKSNESGKENYVISNNQFYVIDATPATMKGTCAYLVLDTPSDGVKSIVPFEKLMTNDDISATVPNQTLEGPNNPFDNINYKFEYANNNYSQSYAQDFITAMGVVVKDGETVLSLGTDYLFGSVTLADGNPIGEYSTIGDVCKVEIVGKGAYTGSRWATFTVISPSATGMTLEAKQYTVFGQSDYWTTFYCGSIGFSIDAAENACAYTATYEVIGEEGKITLHKLGKVIPKGTAVIIVGADASISMTTSTADAENTVSNDLRGLDAATALSDVKATYSADAILVLSNKDGNFGFHELAMTNVPARKAFLALSGETALARELTIVFDDATGIHSIDNGQLTIDSSAGAWYSLDGRRLSGKPTAKGVYILGGKKIIVK